MHKWSAYLKEHLVAESPEREDMLERFPTPADYGDYYVFVATHPNATDEVDADIVFADAMPEPTEASKEVVEAMEYLKKVFPVDEELTEEEQATLETGRQVVKDAAQVVVDEYKEAQKVIRFAATSSIDILLNSHTSESAVVMSKKNASNLHEYLASLELEV